jgi:hypothetical protein
MVKTLSLRIYKRDISITVPSTRLFPGGISFTPNIQTTWCEPNIAGALLQLPLGLKDLSLAVYRYQSDDPAVDSPLMSNAMTSMFPGFDSLTSPLPVIPSLQELRSLQWHGSDFHWVLARSPLLETLQLLRTTRILPDAAPNEFNNTLEYLSLTNRSPLMNSESDQHEHLEPFLSHFPALDHLVFTIMDDRDGNYNARHDVTSDNQGSFAVLISKLRPIASTLTRLCMWTSELRDDDSSRWVDHVLPCDGFAHFKSLRSLSVPYQCLFGPVDPQWSHIAPPPSELLPSTLEELDIQYPKVAILYLLERLSYSHADFPALNQITLHCTNNHGDPYNEFAFEFYSHAAFSSLR